MRDFFKDCMKNLYVYCGNRQIEKMEDSEIKTLLDALERMSKLYGYIPEERQKEIITNCLLTDKDYQNINVRTVSKWLELNGKQYFKEEAHEHKDDPEWKPLEGEARDKRINEFLQAIANTTSEFTQAMDEGKQGSGSRMKAALKPMQKKEFAVTGVEPPFMIYAYSQEECDMIYRNEVAK